MSNNYLVYIHIFPNKKKYVGMTGRKAEIRWEKGRAYSKNEAMMDDIIKYGWDNIEHKIMYKNLTKEQATELEMYYIIQYNTTDPANGYNLLKGTNLEYRNKLKTIMRQKRRVYCTTTNVAGNIFAASRYANTTMVDIDNCCNGLYSYAGERNGEKLKWKYVE